ncbi:MAG TPA: ABC transporter ATP-binding protein [Rhodoglobus sp.]|nr:ABC transporter ATP-binding protein [Actinomycetota bacterium]HOT32852.1 ABC transporter ATP-binding protein [Rhodoglobus sp.]HOW01040.1 ABC transporter ATP-binding protein [Rhodoglobus sp.]HOY82445.1 ABC transporter ATP-binding protein [Rhodoglobus sp.]HPG76202.1 ABC transporter ATP-binding protein [Rhodoglobus sp.]
MTLALETQALTKRYGRRLALDAVDLAVEPGTVFGVIGPNGAGKTTTMRLLLDIIRPTSGSARVLGQDPRQGGVELRRRIGFLPGELRLEGRVTGRALLKHYAEISGPVAPGVVDSLAQRLDLDLSRQVRKLSKGNKQKLGVVQAFMHQPDLLVLDEPTSGLDPLVQQEFLTMVREAKNNGQTVFLSSHVLSEIQQAADSVAILRAGRIVTVSDVDTLRATALRRVNATIADATADAVRTAFARDQHLAELTITAGDSLTIAGTLEGDIDPFVKAIAAFTVVDLRVEEPDLEESVLGLYAKESTDD